MIWSNFSVASLSVNNSVNSSKAAISVVHAPESCSSMPFRFLEDLRSRGMRSLNVERALSARVRILEK
jgi:hypothetical protein